MSVFDFIKLFGGLALFLYGMRIMGDSLKHGASGAVKNAMEKVTNNPFVGFILGLCVTAIIQSSTATIVLTAGLVGAGIIKLNQSIGIILGANVGTTVTGQIIRLLDVNGGENSWLNAFKPDTLAPVAAVIGIILIMAFRFRNSDTIGTICLGFAILFTGLINMTAAVAPLAESDALGNLFVSIADKPVLGFLSGAGVAFSIQSSSATIGILQALATTGKLSFGSVYSIIVGIYLGDCVTTAIVCSIGARADAKRTGLIHILFNLSEAVLVFTGVTVANSFGLFGSFWSDRITSGGIANTHTIFNLVCALLLLPFCKIFEKAARKIIKDDKDGVAGRFDNEISGLDRDFYSSPALALSSAHTLVSTIAGVTCNSVNEAMQLVTDEYDKKVTERIAEFEEGVDRMTDLGSNYLIELSPHITTDDNSNEILNYYLKTVSDFERIGDYAINLTENAESLDEKGITMSDDAKKELSTVATALREIMSYTCKAFVMNDREAAVHIEPVEEVIDDLIETLRANHIKRLRHGNCNVYAGCAFMDILVNAERVADHCSNIGVNTIVLLDKKSADTGHDYIKYLHQGNDETFNEEYTVLHKKYFDMLGA